MNPSANAHLSEMGRPLNGNQGEQTSRLIQLPSFHLLSNRAQQIADPLLIGGQANAVAFTACLKEQTTAQLSERGWRSAIRQIGAWGKAAHHLVTIDGVGEAFPSSKLCLRIRDALQQQLLIGNQVQWHTQSKGDDLSFGGTGNQDIPRMREPSPPTPHSFG